MTERYISEVTIDDPSEKPNALRTKQTFFLWKPKITVKEKQI